MKPKILLCFLAFLVLFSCKKEKKNTPAPILYPVNFDVSNFSSTEYPIGKVKAGKLGTNAVTDTLPQQLYYIFYNADGIITSKRTANNNDNFGKFTENVPPGNYTAVFCAGSNNLKNISNSAFSYVASLFNVKQVYWEDTFFKRVPVTVTASAVNQNVTMRRITAQLQLNIEDAIPADVKKITVTFNDTTSVNVAATPGNMVANSNGAAATLATADAGKVNYKLLMYTLNNVTPFKVTINYYKTDLNNPYATKIVDNVVCKSNKTTVLSGKLFDPANAGFTVTLNDAWGTPDNINF